MRPALSPALRRLWRDDTTMQLGLSPAHAVLLAGLDTVQARWVERLDGSRDRAGWISAAAGDGVDRAEAERLLTVLEDAGALVDASQPRSLLDGLPAEERERLEPDQLALSLQHADPRPAGLARRECVVEVRGLGRVGATTATLLASAGIGRVIPVDPSAARRSDAAPGGLLARDQGLPRERAARRAIARAAPSTDTRASAARPDLVVLAIEGTAAADALTLLRDGTPHLVAAVTETTGVVGPFVVPGQTACVRCLDLHRTQRDPAWPRLLAQLATGRPLTPCDVTLAALVSATTASQALSWVDTAGRLPATANGTLEITSPDWRFRRRSWPPHPACGCGWHQWAEDDTMTG